MAAGVYLAAIASHLNLIFGDSQRRFFICSLLHWLAYLFAFRTRSTAVEQREKASRVAKMKYMACNSNIRHRTMYMYMEHKHSNAAKCFV